MDEFPNLSYVHEIANGDFDFVKRFTDKFKEEFRWEVGMYLRYIEKKEPREAAEIISKFKYKLRILGLEKAFNFAVNYEQNLQIGNDKHHPDFRKILEQVNQFLSKV